MNFSMRKPCPQCPFRTDIRPFISAERAEEITDALVYGGATFACHKTIGFDDDGGSHDLPDSEHCAGAMIMLEHMETPNQMMRIAERLGIYDRTKLKMDSPVYESADEMIEAHQNP